MPGLSQDVLYADIGLDLSWSEEQLPQSQRTKHVHSLHPYLGKFVPQLAEFFLRRHFVAGDTVYDPFAGSGTTLVEANVLGVNSVGCDISAFNCLLASVKAGRFPLAQLELSLRTALEEARQGGSERSTSPTDWLEAWYAPEALGELLAYRQAISRRTLPAWAVGSIILSRAARSARQTTHFDLDFPRAPTIEPYHCFKHKRICRPVREARKFLTRYTTDTIRRLREFAELQTPARVGVVHDDSRTVDLPDGISGVVTSPPYPGLIDYHEQHRYAYELLALPDRRAAEIGAAAGGVSRRSLETYVDSISRTFSNARRFMERGAPVIVVVNDSRDLYPEILKRSSLALEERITRHVNRRTGRRAGEFYESVLVCVTE